ncbi:alpha/beta fold hydrolase [Ruegeria sp. 2205SS24-7]|uniref:alpha/beta fold hydrolase n=1 Tax=Ruegeria discodermiae TaxID=3064389 RepID=UPI002741FB97|nr:alpha/beta fold hydrolase [Ruegeria sp. 2205SS24-7]MDP5218748.1 alpha/beta fold hydrolase [Ruegeria sp. 2205SS24-7]
MPSPTPQSPLGEHEAPVAQTHQRPSPLCDAEPSRSHPVLALHSSGSGAKQWRYLQDALGQRRNILFPQLAETEMVARGWTMEDYRLEIEAEPLVKHLHRLGRPAHLIGHSFGGGVALHIAQRHPEHVASLCLYEPTAFHVLRPGKAADRSLFQDLEILGISVQDAVDRGLPEFGAQLVTEFWGGLGAWEALSPQRREALAKWAPKAPLDCGALLYEERRIPVPEDIPFTLIYGAETHMHTRRIVEVLAGETKQARVVVHSGANHFGPILCREQTAQLIGHHIERAEHRTTA